MRTKRIAHRIYALTVGGVTYNIDGQNHEGSSNEWELYEANNSGGLDWWETFDTKQDAITWIVERVVS